MAHNNRKTKQEKNSMHGGKKGKPRDGLHPRMTQAFKGPRSAKIRDLNENEEPSMLRSSLSLLAGEDDAPAFPRGGVSLLTPTEEAEARAEAEEEFNREERQSKKYGKNKRIRPRGEEDDWASLFGEGISGKLPRFANRISMKNISLNMKIWGVIMEVNQKDLIISLPGGLKGFVRAEDASNIFPNNPSKDIGSNSLCSMYHVGQLVPCIVLRVEDDKVEGKGSKRIILSLNLSLLHKALTLDSIQDGMVLNATVGSIEDHGYILHFGPALFSGFLPKDGSENLRNGQLVQGVVTRIDKAHSVVHLCSDTELVSKSVIKDLKGLSIDSLVPGMLVSAHVHAALENGIMLSFLTYFTGTVDIFHLHTLFPGSSWKDDYYKNKKVNARILFIDPLTRAVGLTLNPHLIGNSVPPVYVKVGDIFDNSKIIRVDRGIGFLLEIPSSPEFSPAYIKRFDAADDEVRKLEKKFKEGSCVRVRILGLRNLEGVAIGTLKASAFEGSIFTHSDVKPGMVAKAKVIAVEIFGAIVQFSSGLKALCPLPHMSEFEIAKPTKKFKIGSELLFRVLGCKSKRITVTYKKTLVKSKLDVLASYTDAVEGLVTHGWITKIEKHGCFVRFYNGVHGFASRSELCLDPGSEPASMYHVGQVVKCRVVSSVPSARRINLSFSTTSKRSSGNDEHHLGSIVSGVVGRVNPGGITVELSTTSYSTGTIPNEHLADHRGQSSLFKSLLKPGYKFDQLLVLDVKGNNLILSAKHSLITSSKELPLVAAQIRSHSVVHGYICNVISGGCFVRFLGHLTGFCPLNKSSDESISSLADAFYVGQSIRSHIVNVNMDTGRISVSLKQSSCFSTDASYIQGYFLLDEKIAELQASGLESCHPTAVRDFHIGQMVDGEVQEKKDFGVVINFQNYNDVVGFITNYQMDGKCLDVGTSVKALVIDISAAEGLIDLSLRSELLHGLDVGKTKPSKKKRQRNVSVELVFNKTVEAFVEIVKENYLVLSLPDCNNAVGFASLTDYNTGRLPHGNYVEGQSVKATIEALPSPSTSGRLLLLLKSLTEASDTSSSKRAKKKSAFMVGSVVQAEVIDVKPLNLVLKFGTSSIGKVHITEVTDDALMENPLTGYKIGQTLTARIIGKCLNSEKGGNGCQWELSLQESRLAGTLDNIPVEIVADEFNFIVGQVVKGFVVKVDDEWVSLTVSLSVSAQLYILDSSSDPVELIEFRNCYSVGMAVSGRIISINKEKKLLRLMTRLHATTKRGMHLNDLFEDESGDRNVTKFKEAEHIVQGDIVGGRVKKILPGVCGLLVQIGPHLYGKAHYTELTNEWSSDPLSGYQEGHYVKCKILEIGRSLEGFMHVDLSLRTSFLAKLPGVLVDLVGNDGDSSSQRFERVEDIYQNLKVKGYVKNLTSKGCFIMLSRKIDARILLSNLSDTYIENLEEEFPVGKLVHGRVLSIEPLSRRVDVTLRTTSEARPSKSVLSDISNVHVGDVVSGKIKRVESYGLFIAIDHTNIVGLCHISEISDNPIGNIESRFRTDDIVTTKILKVDEERCRVSLGMKDLYDVNNDINSKDSEANNTFDLTCHNVQPNFDLLSFQDIESKQECPNSRVLVPLNVSLDDISDSDLDNCSTATESINVNDKITEKMAKRLKKKDREKRELEISASEERRLQNDLPRTQDEFEKLVRSSPNSSFVYIKYMAYLLSLADIEKARSIAERALRTMNIREEDEKLNVWVAYLNLENEYGTPREESVRKTFERALQCCDPKRLHLALLGIYERTEQSKLANELLEKMTKKFRSSCKVWLRYVQSLLNQCKDAVPNAVSRALLSLPRNKHIKFISQAAILEFKCDAADMGRSMFEGILREYPKRTDLWSVYIDQEIRLGDVEVIRALFERATCLKINPKKMKFLLKKYLEFEKSKGEKEKVEYVMKKAMEYVKSSLS